MAHLVRKRKAQAPPAPIIPAHMAKQMRKSGFVVPQVGLNHEVLPAHLYVTLAAT